MNLIKYVKQSLKSNFCLWVVAFIISFVICGVEDCLRLNVNVLSYSMLLSSLLASMLILSGVLGLHYAVRKSKFLNDFTDTRLVKITILALECVCIFEIFLPMLIKG